MSANGGPWAKLARLRRSRSSAILAYHGVQRLSQEDDPELLCIDPDLFEAHISVLLEAGYEFLTVRDYVNRPERGGLVAITFDDGLENLRTVALPLLQKLGVPATVYVQTGIIGEPYPWALEQSGLRIMSADQIRELDAAGIEIGAHTVTHRDLSACSYEEALDEMVQSRQALEEIIDRPVTTFAYPYARYSDSAERAAKDAGFTAALSYSMLTDGRSKYALSRELVTPQHGRGSVVLKVLGLYDRVTQSSAGTALRALTRPLRKRPGEPIKERE